MQSEEKCYCYYTISTLLLIAKCFIKINLLYIFYLSKFQRDFWKSLYYFETQCNAPLMLMFAFDLIFICNYNYNYKQTKTRNDLVERWHKCIDFHYLRQWSPKYGLKRRFKSMLFLRCVKWLFVKYFCLFRLICKSSSNKELVRQRLIIWSKYDR